MIGGDPECGPCLPVEMASRSMAGREPVAGMDMHMTQAVSWRRSRVDAHGLWSPGLVYHRGGDGPRENLACRCPFPVTRACLICADRGQGRRGNCRDCDFCFHRAPSWRSCAGWSLLAWTRRDVEVLLRANLPYQGFELLSRSRMALPNRGQSARLAANYRMHCRGVARRFAVRVDRGENTVLNVVVALRPGNPVILGGFPDGADRLLLVLMASP